MKMRNWLLLTLIWIVSSCKSSEKISSDNKNTCQNGDFVLLASADGSLTLLNSESGEICWNTIIDPNSFVSSSLSKLQVYENGSLHWVVPSLDGTLFKYDQKKLEPLPVDAESLLMHFNLHSSVNIVGGRFKQIFGINRHSGEICFTCTADDCVNFKDVSLKDLLIIEEIIQNVKAVDSTKGQKRWHFRVVELVIKAATEVSDSILARNISGLLAGNVTNNSILNFFKVSLRNSSAGLLNNSTMKLSWLFKTSSTLLDAWFISGKTVYLLDPFENENEYYSVDLPNGKSALLFLGVYMDEFFVKISKKEPTNVNVGSLSTKIKHEDYTLPVCKQGDMFSVGTPNHLPIPAFEDFDDFDDLDDFKVKNSLNSVVLIQNIIVNDSGIQDCAISELWIYTFVITTTASFSIAISCAFTIYFYGIRKRRVHQKSIVHHVATEIETPIIDSAHVIPFQRQEFTSRFMEDFEIIDLLGKGGFGIVLKAKNKIDECQYAVKRIAIKLDIMRVDAERCIREVKSLAILDHPGIVRYFNSWIETPPRGWQDDLDKILNIKSDPKVPLKRNVQEPCLPVETVMRQKLKVNPLRPFDTTGLEAPSAKEHPSCVLSTEPGPSGYAGPLTKTVHKMRHGILSRKPNPVEQKVGETSKQNPVVEISQCSKVYSSQRASTSQEVSDSYGISFREPSGVEQKVEVPKQNLDVESSPSSEKISSQRVSKNQEHSSEIKVDSVSNEQPDGEASKGINRQEIQAGDSGGFKPRLSQSKKCPRASGEEPSGINNQEILAGDSGGFEPHLQESSHPSQKAPSNEDVSEHDPAYLYIQMQLCRKDSLRTWLDRHHQDRNSETAMNIFCQIVDAVDYIHSQGLMHRDLKPSNILFTMDGAVKVGDFGLATTYAITDTAASGERTSRLYFHTRDVGTFIYMSPEQKEFRFYDCKTDIYSLGLILLELLVPFRTNTEKYEALMKARNHEYPPEFEASFPEEHQLVEWLLKSHPEGRPLASEIKNHPVYTRYSALNISNIDG